ncbi:MAG: hypothetical protein ACLFP2_04930 [Candidatus Woesearchaeota archaeon]
MSLPRKWCIKNNIKKGEELELTDLGNKLMILTEQENTPLMKKELHLDDKEKYLKYILHSFYQKGYTEVMLTYDDERIADVIQRMLHEEMVGFEVVEQSPKMSVIRSVAGALPSEFDAILKRAFSLTVSMYEGMVDNLVQGRFQAIGSLSYMEGNVYKYVTFCTRMINSGLKDKNVTQYSVLKTIERIAREMKFLCIELNKNNSIDKNTKELIKEIYSLLKESYELYYSYDLKKTLELFERRLEIIKKLKKEFKSDCMNAHYLCNITQYIFDLSKTKMQMEI